MRQELLNLAAAFPADKPLYAVGGYVRDMLMGRETGDIDLSSACTQERVSEIAQAAGFRVVRGSQRLGTVIIKGEDSYEYTPFRVDSYPAGSGVHKPDSVRFTDDISEDARRRDFTVNAMYYDIAAGKITDIVGGEADLRACVLRCVDDPERVLGEDGLRIMRLFRFQSVLGFDTERSTWEASCKLRDRLKDIAPERIREEFNKLLAGEHVGKALRALVKSGVLEIIMPEMAENIGVDQPPQYHKYNVMEHIIRTVEAAPVNIRLAAFMHDIGKGRCMKTCGNMYEHACVGADMTRGVMERLRYPKAEIKRTVRLVEAHMTDMRGDMSEYKLRRFIARNSDIVEDLTALILADAAATGYQTDNDKSLRIYRLYNAMIQEHIPMSVGDLRINGDDLRSLGYEGRQIGEELEKILEMCIFGVKPNDREVLMDMLRRRKKNGK